MSDRDEAMRVVTERLACFDRVWEIVIGAESEDQGYVRVSDIRAAITTRRES